MSIRNACNNQIDSCSMIVKDSIREFRIVTSLLERDIAHLQQNESHTSQIISTANASIANQIASLGIVVSALSIAAALGVLILGIILNSYLKKMNKIKNMSEHLHNEAMDAAKKSRELFDDFNHNKGKIFADIQNLQIDFFIKKIELEPRNAINIREHLAVFDLNENQLDRLFQVATKQEDIEVLHGLYQIIISSSRKKVLESSGSRHFVLDNIVGIWYGLFKHEIRSLCEEVNRIAKLNEETEEYFKDFTAKVLINQLNHMDIAIPALFCNDKSEFAKYVGPEGVIPIEPNLYETYAKFI